jgi:hypothetical protein
MTLRNKTVGALIAATSLSVFLVACGSGSDAPAINVFLSKFDGNFGQLATPAGMTSSALTDLFDEAYLDAGYTKAQLKTTLAADAAALTASPDLSLFPNATMSNITVSGCDANGICILSATLKNTDVDATEVAFTTKVKNVNNSYVFYGDQASS